VVDLSGGGISAVSQAPGRNVYQVTSAESNGIFLNIRQTDPASPVRNISVQAPFGNLPGATFNPGYTKTLANYGVLRFMDWNATNNHKISDWTERSSPDDMFWGTAKGVPYEFQIQLSNEQHKDLWLTVPHLANDDYVQNLAKLVREKLSPDLRVWIEYSNEVWNPQFEQFHYANDVLVPRYGVPSTSQAYGRRSAEIFDFFKAEFPDSNRIVRVISGQAANSWVLDQALIGATTDGVVNADVAAVTGYFGVDIDALYAKHLQGEATLDTVFAAIDATLANMNWMTANREHAAARGLPLVAYEGGQHLVAKPGEQHNDASFVDLLTQANRDPRMGEMYEKLLTKWYANGGKTIAFFNDIGRPTKWGAWGLQETYNDVNATKYRAVNDYLEDIYRKQADANGDGAVDALDFDLWRNSFGSTVELAADANANGQIDAADYVLWRQQATTASSVVSGDFDRNGTVDADDYRLWRSAFSSTSDLVADANGNQSVDAADYVLWRNGAELSTVAATGGASSVPEPGIAISLATVSMGYVYITCVERYAAQSKSDRLLQ
jgi:hypothetical protein